MKNETKNWIKYAIENLESAKVLIDSQLYNPCLQNAQQSVEKALKALLIEHSIKFFKTHSISELKYTLEKNGIIIEIKDEEKNASYWIPFICHLSIRYQACYLISSLIGKFVRLVLI
jgi:HEPN domain-containing protein